MFNAKSSFLGIYKSTVSCIVKLLDEVCASHTERLRDNKGRFPKSRNFSTCAKAKHLHPEAMHVARKPIYYSVKIRDQNLCASCLYYTCH